MCQEVRQHEAILIFGLIRITHRLISLLMICGPWGAASVPLECSGGLTTGQRRHHLLNSHPTRYPFMSDIDQNHLKAARLHWLSSRPLEAGRLIYDNLPVPVRPAWAAGILRLVLSRSCIESSLFEGIL